jgi:ABC-type antimicrobial peptide transport system permease subunit
LILDNIERTDDPSYLKIVVKSFVIPALVFNLFNLVLFLLSKYLKSISWSVFPNSIKDFAVSLKLNNSHFSMLLSVTLEGNAFRASFISI